MPTFFVIAPTIVQHESVSVPVVCNVGDVIKYADEPSVTMVAISAAAVEAKARVAKRQDAEARRIDARLERRFRARLPRALATKLAQLEAQLSSEVAA